MTKVNQIGDKVVSFLIHSCIALMVIISLLGLGIVCTELGKWVLTSAQG